MPVYEYLCEACGKHQEHIRKFSDEPLTDCELCGAKGTLVKQISRSSFALKGSGWYTTDYKRAAKPGTAEGEKPGASEGEKPAGSDTASPAGGEKSTSGSGGDKSTSASGEKSTPASGGDKSQATSAAPKETAKPVAPKSSGNSKV